MVFSSVDDKGCQRDPGRDEQRDDHLRAPAIAPAFTDGEQEQDEKARHGEDADGIEGTGALVLGFRHGEEDDAGAQQPDRHVHIKNRPPIEDLDEMTAEGGGDSRPEGKTEIIQPQGEAAFVGWEGAVQDAHAERDDGATTNALQDAEENQGVHVPGQAAERRASDKDEGGEDEQPLRPQPCPQPSDRGYEDRLGDLVGGLHPLDAVEVGAQAAHHAGDGDVQHPLAERHGERAEHHPTGRPPVG